MSNSMINCLPNRMDNIESIVHNLLCVLSLVSTYPSAYIEPQSPATILYTAKSSSIPRPLETKPLGTFINQNTNIADQQANRNFV